jgi:hypothetical protein
VIGKAADVAFKTTGKVIYKRMAHCFESQLKEKKQIYYPTLLKAKRTTNPRFRKGN